MNARELHVADHRGLPPQPQEEGAVALGEDMSTVLKRTAIKTESRCWVKWNGWRRWVRGDAPELFEGDITDYLDSASKDLKEPCHPVEFSVVPTEYLNLLEQLHSKVADELNGVEGGEDDPCFKIGVQIDEMKREEPAL